MIEIAPDYKIRPSSSHM